MTGPQPRRAVTVATCWCEQHLVIVTWTQVRRGETRSCGRRGCYPPTPDANPISSGK